MTRAKWIHKYVSSDNLNMDTACGAFIKRAISADIYWRNVTCPKCLAKKPTKKKKQSETDLYFEMDGKVFVTERKKDGTVVSQEEIGGKVVLDCMITLLEQAVKVEEMAQVVEKWMHRYDKKTP